jgi:hypothetical protein
VSGAWHSPTRPRGAVRLHHALRRETDAGAGACAALLMRCLTDVDAECWLSRSRWLCRAPSAPPAAAHGASFGASGRRDPPSSMARFDSSGLIVHPHTPCRCHRCRRAVQTCHASERWHSQRWGPAAAGRCGAQPTDRSEAAGGSPRPARRRAVVCPRMTGPDGAAVLVRRRCRLMLTSRALYPSRAAAASL